MLEMFLINLGVSLVKKAIASSSNKTDDKILEIAQDATKYLAKESTNTVSEVMANELASVVIEKVKG